MEDRLHDQHGRKEEEYCQDVSSTHYEEVDSCTKPSKDMPLNECPPQKEPSKEEIGDNLTSADLNRESLRRVSPKTIENTAKARHLRRTNAKDAAKSVECNDNDKNNEDGDDDDDPDDDDDDDNDDDRDVMKKLRNGCDKTFFDQIQQDIYVLSDELKNINLSKTSSDKVLKENIPKKPSDDSKQFVNSSTSMHKTISTPSNTFSAVIPLAGPNTTKARGTDQCKSKKYDQDLGVNERLDETAPDLCVRGAMRGKNVAQCITNNISTEAVHVSNSNNCTTAIGNQKPLKYACQSSYIKVLPLHACNTFNHPHHNLLHIHHYRNHKNQSESEMFANELTNALSSRLLLQITNNSYYCTNSSSKRQSKRQSSFIKSHSLEIVQDSPSIIHHQTDDLDEQLFFQTPEIDIDELQQNHRLQEHGEGIKQQLNVADAPSTTNSGENASNEGVAITRSLSLSSQKTGVALKTQSLESRPIYPNVPYSPYASPYSSPRSNRRRPPLRESRRVSIEQTGSFLQLNQYKLMDQIGQGSYGLVKLAYSEEDSTHYAMKILSKRRLLRQAGLMKRGPKKATSPLDRVYREIAVLKKLDHPNVVKLIEVLDDPEEDSLYMVFELVKQGEVLSVPTNNPLSEEKYWNVFRDTILGLEYLHYQRIIHGDIKPGNLLLTECGRVKIADLGVCNEFIGEDATMTNGSTAGTPAFRAPESLNMGENIYCGKAADIWALGATLYALVYGNVPFIASSVPALYEKIKTEEVSFPENPIVSAELKDCILSMLKKDPLDRITLPQLKEHVWVTAGDLHPLPSEEENCRLVQVNEDDISTVVRSIPKLDTLILIKTMLKKHSFGNPFLRGISGRAPQRGGSRLERFVRAGRSNSAPGSYNMIADRQLSGDNILPALCENSATSCVKEENQ